MRWCNPRNYLNDQLLFARRLCCCEWVIPHYCATTKARLVKTTNIGEPCETLWFYQIVHMLIK